MPDRLGNSTSLCLKLALLLAWLPAAQRPQCLAQPAAAPATESTAETTPAVVSLSPAEIKQLIAQLDSDQFDTRQRAQQQLELAGLPALEAVATTAQTGSLESATRAINILLYWTESENHALQIAALEKLANLHNHPRESAMASRLLANTREQAALKKLTDLGAEIKPAGQMFYSIRIGADWKGGDQGLKHLAEVPHAYLVQLHVAPLTDPALEHLKNLKQLRKIELYSIDFSEAAVQKLQDQLPTTLVEIRKGAMLGISGNMNDPVRTSVGVGGVVKGGAADRAGIQRNDRITEINGQPVLLFTDLTDQIKNFQADDSAKLTVLRKGKTLEVTVTFDHWGENDNSNLTHRPAPQFIQRLPTQSDQPRQRR